MDHITLQEPTTTPIQPSTTIILTNNTVHDTKALLDNGLDDIINVATTLNPGHDWPWLTICKLESLRREFTDEPHAHAFLYHQSLHVPGAGTYRVEIKHSRHDVLYIDVSADP